MQVDDIAIKGATMRVRAVGSNRGFALVLLLGAAVCTPLGNTPAADAPTPKPTISGAPVITISNQNANLKREVGAEPGWTCTMGRTADGKAVITVTTTFEGGECLTGTGMQSGLTGLIIEVADATVAVLS